jgi:tetratricopeptide (TPR) repeat protein
LPPEIRERTERWFKVIIQPTNIKIGAEVKTFTLLLFCLIFWHCSSSGPQKPAGDNPKTAFVYFYDAEKDISRGDLQTALTNLDSAISYNPGYASFYQLKGWVLENLDQPDSAIAVYRKCLSYRSAYPKVWVRIGRLHLKAKDYENAAFYLRKAVQEYPDSASIHLDLGEAYYMYHRYHLARDHLRGYRKLVKNPDPEYWKWIGLTYYQTGEYKEAVEPLQNYVAEEKYDGMALKYLGIAKFNAGEHHESISYLNSAAELRAFDPEIYLYRARYFLLYDKPDVARYDLNAGLEADSLNRDILFELGVLDYKEEKYEDSKEHLLKLVRIAPQYWSAYRYLGFLAERDEELLLAQEYYQLYLKNTLLEDTEVLRRLENISSHSQKQ